MAKQIYITQNEIDSLIDELKNQLSANKCYGSIEIKKTLKKDDRCAVLYFTPTAWIKMSTLVSEFSTEVQWHGLVRRISESEFEIYDILVPPHKVTAATVTSDQEKYSEWINSLEDDEFNDLKFHGHSHVNMAVTPSVTDMDYRKDVVTQLPKPMNNEDAFYIFLIINKSHSWSAEIYDLKYNALYSTASDEIELSVILDNGEILDEFISEAKTLAVSSSTTAYKGATGKSGSYSNFGCYSKSEPYKKNHKEDDEYYGVDEDPCDPFYTRSDFDYWRK